MLTPEEAQALIDKNSRNRDVLFPYLNGEDLNSRPDQSASRWVINFHDWPLERAETYPDCMRIVREKVKPERDKNNRKVYRDRWWHFAEKRPELYATIAGMERVLVAVQTSKYLSLGFQPAGIVYSHMTVVFALDDYSSFSILKASWHTDWIVEYCSSLETRLRYLPSDGFDTFPFPAAKRDAEDVGGRYYAHRQFVMLQRNEGLTRSYNRLHDPDETANDIAKLRDLHIEMDYAVASAYGWDDLDLNHGFHQTKQGLRYTISEEARREVLGRLLALNHERYKQEVAMGLHAKTGKKAGRRAKAEAAEQMALAL